MNKPSYRKLRGYAFDPSVSLSVETALINEIVYKIPWEENGPLEDEKGGKLDPADWSVSLDNGICGEYIEVIDYDPTVKQYYQPAKLNDPYVLAQDGYSPSESNPQFHQQMVYAVAMTTIRNFEIALGRKVLWSSRVVKKTKENQAKKYGEVPDENEWEDKFIHALRIYPHAFRGANAYYSPDKKALLFGYFSARPAENTIAMPNSLVFTCLSHDIIAHETAHAILDGMYPRYIDNTNPDTLAFHEAFADIIALFQHFTFADVLKHEIAITRGDLFAENMLGKLAREFGLSIGNYNALRDAIGKINEDTKEWEPKKVNGNEYQTEFEPHARGAILVAAVFEAFVNIYKHRSADLLCIATGGTGVLPQGNLHPDLVNRLANEAAKSARHVLSMCIRALDYCPPVDITFGDYLRAIITADTDLVPDDALNYRLVFIDAFRRRGIYPDGIRTLSVESLNHPTPDTTKVEDILSKLTEFLREFRSAVMYETDRKQIFDKTRDFIAVGPKQNDPRAIKGLHKHIFEKFDDSPEFEKITGLVFRRNWESCGLEKTARYGSHNDSPPFSVQSLHVASRTAPDGTLRNQIVVGLLQKAKVFVKKKGSGEEFFTKDLYKNPSSIENELPSFHLRGGVTLIFDLDSLKLKYAICKPLLDLEFPGEHKIDQTRARRIFRQTYPGGLTDLNSFVPENAEPFYLLHHG